MQILTHNPSLSSVSRYPVASKSPRAEARHHQPDLPRAPTPRAFARASSLPITIHPNIRYRTYLVLLFNTTGEEILVLFVQSHYTWLLGLLTNPIKRSCCVLFFVRHLQYVSREGAIDARLNSLNVRVSDIYEYMVHQQTS